MSIEEVTEEVTMEAVLGLALLIGLFVLANKALDHLGSPRPTDGQRPPPAPREIDARYERAEEAGYFDGFLIGSYLYGWGPFGSHEHDHDRSLDWSDDDGLGHDDFDDFDGW